MAKTQTKPGKNAVSADFLDEMGVDTSVGEDKLIEIKNTIRKARDLDLEIETLAKVAGTKSEEKNTILHATLPEMFIEVGIDKIGLEAEGGLPAYDTQLKPYYKAGIPKDKEAEAFAWLEKKKHGDMIKNVFTVQLGRGDNAKAKKLEAFLKKEKMSYERKLGVPWNTLTAFVKEQIEVYKVKLKDLPLDLLGATVGQIVTLKPRKAKD